MTHLSTPFPAALSYGSSGGPVYRVTVVQAYSGKEERNQSWAYPLHTYSIDLSNRLQSELETLVTYYHAAGGREHTFSFKDPRDYKSCALSGTVANTDQTLRTATGGETDVQIIKVYTAGSISRTRKITRPISGTVTVAIDGTPVTTGAGDYTVDYTTGVITFATGLATGEVVTAGYEFYVPCRFDSDNLDLAITTANCNTGLIGTISADIVEVRE